MDSIENFPLVTAIITTHNRKDLVLKAISSVQKQTYQNIEIVVVDDHSTDGSKEIIEEYIKDTNIRYIYNIDDLGGNHIRNIGIMEAKGDFVAFLDDDDEWLPKKIEKQLAFLKANPNVGVVVCGRIILLDFDSRTESDLSKLPDGDYSQNIFKGVFFPTSSLLVKKDFLIQSGLFDERLMFWQEYELYMRLAQITEFGSVMEHLYLYRAFSVDNNSKRLTDNLSDWQKAVKYINNKHKEKIDRLPDDILREYKLFTTRDGCRRSVRSGNKKELHKYLQDLYQLQPNIVNLLRLLTNHFITKDSIKIFIRSGTSANGKTKTNNDVIDAV